MISATYICPVKGLTGLEPPDPVRLSQSAKVARSLGLEKLLLPVLEEALVGATRSKVHYLDGLVQAMDQVAEADLQGWLIVPAQRIMGLDFVPPHLVKGGRDPGAGRLFVDGKIRHLWPFDWWGDPTVIQKRIKVFREVVTALSGHPAIQGWVIMDRALEWSRPELEVADLVLKSYVAEIRERDEGGAVYLGLGWSELLHPEMAQALVAQVDGLHMTGLDLQLPGLEHPDHLAGELLMVSYLGILAQWLFQRPLDVEIGWGLLDRRVDFEEIVEAGKRLARQGITGVNWISLIDPEPGLHNQPPWALKSGLHRVGLLDRGAEPKEHVETWLKEFLSCEPGERIEGFIDIGKEEYTSDPHTHLPRLWDHFRE